jgi:NAD(P)H-hydrate epimerase
MQTIGANEQQILEKAAAEAGIPTLLLMESAAHAVAERALQLVAEHDLQRVMVLCGAGNNGGDGYATARMLLGRVQHLQVFEAEAAEDNQGDAHLNRQICLNLGITPQPFSAFKPSDGLIIDAVYGSGFKADRPLSAEFESLARKVNQARMEQGALILAVDLPSGVQADHGQVAPTVIQADETLSFLYIKTGLVSYPGHKAAGKVHVHDLDLPESFLDRVWQQKRLHTPSALTAEELRAWRPQRPKDAHKGTFGRLAILAGSPGLAGAAILSGRAAEIAGAGYVSLTVPAEIYAALLEAAPSLLSAPLPEEPLGQGTIAAAQLDFWKQRVESCDAALVGPGLGKSTPSRPDLNSLVLAAIAEAPRLVLDADGLNLLAEPDFLETGRAALRARTQSGLEPAILTPHPGEFRRLYPEMAATVERDRIACAETLAALTSSVVVLKGAGTVIAFPPEQGTQEVWINTSGNAGMAKAGSGDVLSGLLGSLLAQRLPLREAVCGAVYLHGLAADLQAELLTERALTPEDIISGLPDAFRQVGWDK